MTYRQELMPCSETGSKPRHNHLHPPDNTFSDWPHRRMGRPQGSRKERSNNDGTSCFLEIYIFEVVRSRFAPPRKRFKNSLLDRWLIYFGIYFHHIFSATHSSWTPWKLGRPLINPIELFLKTFLFIFSCCFFHSLWCRSCLLPFSLAKKRE